MEPAHDQPEICEVPECTVQGRYHIQIVSGKEVEEYPACGEHIYEVALAAQRELAEGEYVVAPLLDLG